MIDAAAALQLPGAQSSKDDIDDCRMMMAKIHAHIVKHMTFDGPVPLEVPFREMGRTAARLLCHAMKRHKWNVNANLIAEGARFAGGQPVPHHWVLQVQPVPEVYDEILVDMLPSLSEAPPLDA